MRRFVNFLFILLSFLTITSFSITAYSSGFMLNEYSVTSMGRAFSGSGVMDDDLSAIASNPAGLGAIKDKLRLQVGGTFISMGADFTGSVDPNPLITGVASTKQSGSTFVNIHGIIPNVFAMYSPHERVRVGLGFFVPFGLTTDYDENSIVKYMAIKSNLQVLELTPSVAVRVVDGLYLGASANIQFGSAKLTQKSPAYYSANNTNYGDISVDVDGSGIAVGGSVGIMYEFGETGIGDETRFGLSYRSLVSHSLDGKMTKSFVSNGTALPSAPAGALLLANFENDLDVTANVDLPNIFQLSAYHRFKIPLGVSLTAKYIMWSSFKELNIEGSGTPPVKENWRDTVAVSIGADYLLNDIWCVRLGFSYDMSPVKSAEYLTARLPDSDRFLVGVGVSFIPHPNWVMDIGYTHVIMPDAKTNNTHGAYTQTGTYKYSSASHLIGVQLQFKMW